MDADRDTTPTDPQHYRVGGFEVQAIIRAFTLGWNLGNVLKYVLRAGRKDPTSLVEDLKKALWYLQREIEEQSFGQRVTVPKPEPAEGHKTGMTTDGDHAVRRRDAAQVALLAVEALTARQAKLVADVERLRTLKAVLPRTSPKKRRR